MKAIAVVLAILVIGGLLLFLLKTPTQPAETPNITTTNVTPAKTGAAFGDLVTINFILELENGTIVDTNDEKIAQENKITNYVKGPYNFILGQSGKIPGFDEALLSMKEGDHRETTIEPSEKEIILGVNKTKILPRFITINKKQAFPPKAFQSQFGKPPIKGDIVFNEKFAFKYKVVNITNETVITDIFVKEKEEYTLPGTEWESIVAKVAGEDILFYQNPEENQTLETPFGPAIINLSKSRIYINFQPELNKIFNKSVNVGGFSIQQNFQITEIRENDFVIKRVGVLTDKRLKLKADMLTIIPGVKEVKHDKPIVTEVVGETEN